MQAIVHPARKLEGEFIVPGSKSHTIRGIVIASLAEGKSTIIRPLQSADTQAAVNACRSLGARISCGYEKWEITGFGRLPSTPGKKLNLMNSGTSLNLVAGIAALAPFETILDGDFSLRSRTVQPLLDALNQLGAKAVSLKNNGCPPISVRGTLSGGKATVNGLSSQFVSSLLIATPLASKDTEIVVTNLNEVPYVEMTLAWLAEQGIRCVRNHDFTHFSIKGNQRYHPFQKVIPGDWSTATFPLVAATLIDSDVSIYGLNPDDTQGDRLVLKYLQQMGARIQVKKNSIRIQGGCKLQGVHLDLNRTPDALPALAVIACAAEGKTVLDNVAHARIKETDRISVMASQLRKMGARVEEKRDGLIIYHSRLKGTVVDGHHDHRVVMALTLAGLIAEGLTVVSTAEAAGVTFPGFFEMLQQLGAKVELKE